ncbi:hypothetical protein MTR67_007904 [Solanum verrucosum]|uniref:FBD domain-containing protein n=1 Tax=Solanum verrucosum TaxID=315347 RepID=A0AAF0Q0G3_SOLVR|nr:hypothetical protein MTR67_007904 [Solanum verrucosum]
MEFLLNIQQEIMIFTGFYLDSDSYSLPQKLCSSSSLVKLNCKDCRIPEDRILNWTSLKSLTLSSMLLSEEHIEQITSNCRHLESLKLCGFCGFHCLYLTSPKCKSLELIDHIHHVYYIRCDCYFEIVAPYVQYLKISGDFNGVEIRLGDLSSLIHVDLTYRRLDDIIDKSIVKDHFTRVACANALIISSLHIEWSPFIEDDTTELTELMKCLLEHAKNLEKLIIIREDSDYSESIDSLLALPRVSNCTVVVSLESVAGVEC